MRPPDKSNNKLQSETIYGRKQLYSQHKKGMAGTTQNSVSGSLPHSTLMSFSSVLGDPSSFNQQPTESSKQPIRAHYLCHVTGYHPFREQYSLIQSVPAFNNLTFYSNIKSFLPTIFYIIPLFGTVICRLSMHRF